MRLFFFIHLVAWAIILVFGIAEQLKGRSRPPVYSGLGMYRGGYYPIASAFFVGSIPVLNILFLLWATFEILKEKKTSSE